MRERTRQPVFGIDPQQILGIGSLSVLSDPLFACSAVSCLTLSSLRKAAENAEKSPQ